MAEFDELDQKIQDQILDILYGKSFCFAIGKDQIVETVEDWIGNTNDPDLSVQDWIEQAKKATF